MVGRPDLGTSRGRLTQPSSNLLYAREEKNTQSLVYLCKACRYQEDTEPTCVQRTELGSTAGATAGTTTDVANDPTVGDTSDDVPTACTMCGGDLKCNKCGEESIGKSEVFDQVEAADDPES